MKIAVIGAGIGGLTSACLLAAEGEDVEVYEKNPAVGGKMNRVEEAGFRFDTGPSLLTMPELLTGLFDRCGKSLEEHIDLVPLQPLCRYFYPDGTRFDNFSDLSRSLEEIERVAPEDHQGYIDFLDYARTLYQKTADPFLYNPLYDWSDLSEVDLRDLLAIDALKTVSQRVDDYFTSPYLRRFFKRFATYNGSSPFQAPATLNVIPHVEVNRGGYYVKGGLYSIASALRKLAKSLGVTFHTGSEVAAIMVERGRASGVRLHNGTEVRADAVFSNADAYETYNRLLPPGHTSPIKRELLEHTEPSCSGFVLLLGIDRTYDRLEHHNVFFSADYEAEFRTIFRDKVPARKPTIYIANTSHSDPAHAVQGGANLFVLVNAPYLSEHTDWTTETAPYAEHIKEELERRGLEGLGAAIRFEQRISPLDFYRRYYSNRGSIYGTSSNSRLSAFMRPGNKARSVAGLYLTGGSTHPGGGIPLAILSGMHACTLWKRYG